MIKINSIIRAHPRSSAANKLITWGPDLSGSVGGAGHIGGLLALQDHVDAGEPVYLAGYDGNGNLTSLTDAGDGSLVAAYEYSPFGELLRSTGSFADENPFRFSTKYYDSETELSYYGFRYYSASLGRFINRDPIEERGGWTLYQDLSFATTNPFFSGGSLPGRNFFDEWGEKQDALLRNTSLTHSTEELQIGGFRNSTIASTFEKDKKFYSANANAHSSNQGGSNGLEFDSFPSLTVGLTPSNSDINHYIFAGNNPINAYDALGLFFTPETFWDIGSAVVGVFETGPIFTPENGRKQQNLELPP